MPKQTINDVILLGVGSRTAALGAMLETAGLPWSAVDEPAGLDRIADSALPPAAALVMADLPSAARDAWTAAVRRGGGLWASTPVIVAEPAWREPELLGALEQWMGPLAAPAFRDPVAADYRLLRLVGLDQAKRLLVSLAEALTDARNQGLAGTVPVATAHRLAGLAGLYGFPELGQSWQAVARGESAEQPRALAQTSAALERLGQWLGRDKLIP